MGNTVDAINADESSDMQLMRKKFADKPIAIIAGDGGLPLDIYELCREHEIKVHIIGVKNYFNSDAICAKYSDLQLDKDLSIMPVHKVSKIIDKLHELNIDSVIIAGKVGRSEIPKAAFDRKGRVLMGKLLISGLSDKHVFKTITDFLEDEGISLIQAEAIFPRMRVGIGKITKKEPSFSEHEIIKYGMIALKHISILDIGQGLVAQNGLILGIEGLEGTDNLIKRCGGLKTSDSAAILVKMHKEQQDHRVDAPCIGVDTVKNLYESGLAGVAIGKDSLIINRAQTVRLANELGVFIYGI